MLIDALVMPKKDVKNKDSEREEDADVPEGARKSNNKSDVGKDETELPPPPDAKSFGNKDHGDGNVEGRPSVMKDS